MLSLRQFDEQLYRPAVMLMVAASGLVLGCLLLALSLDWSFLRQSAVVTGWQALALRAGLQDRMLRVAAGLAVPAATMLAAGFGPPGLLLPVLFVIKAPSVILDWLDRRDQQKFEQQLPPMLDTAAAALRSGQTLPLVLADLSRQFPQPMSDVLTQADRQVQVGVPAPTALAKASNQYRIREWLTLHMALSAVVGAGGNIAPIFTEASATLRRRLKVETRLRTLTAQGRFQAYIMLCLPLGMIAALRAVDPMMYEQLTTTLVGWGLLLCAGLLQGIAMVLMRHILRVDV